MAYSNHSGLLPVQKLVEPTHAERDLYERLESASLVAISTTKVLGRDVPLHIHAHRRALAPRPAQTKHDARAVVKEHHLALLRRHRAVDRVRVAKVVHALDRE